jgi:hypothetical protein
METENEFILPILLWQLFLMGIIGLGIYVVVKIYKNIKK